MRTFTAPPVIVGCWQLFERSSNPQDAVKTLGAFHKWGFTTFDTADIYGPSEKAIGDAMAAAGVPEGNFTVHTKYVTQDPSKAEADRINSQSRNALRKSKLDVVQFHWWDFSDTRYVDAWRALIRLQDEGKIDHVAACNYDTEHLKVLVEEAGIPMVQNQVQYSLLDRRPENGMLALAKKHGMKLTCFGTVAGGLLSSKFLGMAEGQARQKLQQGTVSLRMYYSSLDQWSGGDWGLFQQLLQSLDDIAKKHSAVFESDGRGAISVANVWGQWVLDRLDAEAAGGSLIIGVRDTSHLDEMKQYGKFHLDSDDMTKIQKVLDKGRFPKGEDIWSRERGR